MTAIPYTRSNKPKVPGTHRINRLTGVIKGSIHRTVFGRRKYCTVHIVSVPFLIVGPK